MRILVISDIHANLSALDAVLNAAGSVDAVWCLGDLVGYGPDPNECIERVRLLPNLTCLLGNHDSAALGNLDLQSFNHEAQVSMHYMQRTLSMESMRFLASLPQSKVIGDVTLAHGSPRNPIWEYLLDMYTVSANMTALETPLCFVGHTHIQIMYYVGEGNQIQWSAAIPDQKIELNMKAILNPGSVGQPRDHDSRAAFALYDSEAKTWETRRVKYDVQSVQERIKKAGLPLRHALRLSEGW